MSLHYRSLPLTGGVFDVLVEVFQKELVAAGLISAELATRHTQGPGRSRDIGAIQAAFDHAYKGKHEGFKVPP